MRKFLKTTLIICLVLLLTIAVFGCKSTDNGFVQNDRSGDFDLLKNTIDFINANYYKDLDYDEADIYAAYGVMSSLGNYNYIYPESYLYETSSSDGSGFGLLVKFNLYNEVFIDLILDGSPFATAYNGFTPMRGDEIYSIAGYRVSGAGSSYFSSVVSSTTIDEDTTFVLRRDGEFHEVKYRKLMYDFPQCVYINDLNGISSDFGYIYLRSFSSYPNNVQAEFRDAVLSFKADNNKALILDLRGNGGGASEVFKSVASYLIGSPSKGKVDIVEVEYVKDGRKNVYSVTPNSNYIDTPIYVLCDSGTASASEALIGSMKANGTLTALIGKETVGKGVAQNGFIYYNGKEKGNIIDYVTDEEGNVVEDETYYLQVIVGQYYIYDSSVEGGKYCMNGIPFKPDYEVTGTNLVTSNYYDDLYIKIAADLYSNAQ